ncbi:MAG: hypothetical protein HWN65_13475 [Candidatus Helarchaeota archaeon]|nr:hypothetical protein [Candidatus Helarchaeota archaeon]
MKILYNKRYTGILLLFMVLLPNVFILPSMANSQTIRDNYETETTSGVINIYYQSASAFQYVMERMLSPESSYRIVTGATFWYHTNNATTIKILAVDDSSSVEASSDNIQLDDSSGVKNQYVHYFLDDPYLTFRGMHYIRLEGVSNSSTSIHYTDTESGQSFYSNETTGMDNWFMDTKQYFIQFIEEDVVNLTKNENITGEFEWVQYVNQDAVDAYLLDLPAQPVKIVTEIETAGKTLILELYNYTNNGDMALENSTVSITSSNSPVILTHVPPNPGLHVLLVKAASFSADQTNYTLHWINSSNEITISRPVIGFDNSSMQLDISGVFASMDGFFYNGSNYQPEKAEYTIYRDIDDSPVGSNGSIYDGNFDGEWTNLNIDVPWLNPGVYYVKVRFEDNNGYAIGISPESSRFFVLGNLSVSAASVSYIDGVTQKLNITGITVDNSTELDVFTYTIFDNELNANSSISGLLNYESGSQTWSAYNVDVSTLPNGTYYVLGYFEDQSENKYGIGNTTTVLDTFTVAHLIEVNQVFINYTNQWAQLLEIGGLASTSFQGHGTSIPILENESIVNFQIYHAENGYTGFTGNLGWTGTSWNTSAIIANLTEGAHHVQLTFYNDSYGASGHLNSSTFTVDHILNITSVSQQYTGNATQIVSIEINANTSYYGNGVGTPIMDNQDAIVLCTFINNSNSELTSVTGLANWNAVSSSWKADISSASLPEGDYYVMVNFSVISSLYNATSTRNSTTFTVIHIITLTVPTPIFNADTATLDIVGIIATDSYSGYHHINDSTVLSTYFEIFNDTSKASLGIYGGLTYNSTHDDWRNTSIDLSMYPEGAFFIYVDISSIDVPEGAAMNSSPFNLVHKIVITGISLEYTGGFNQTLNITVAYAENTFQNLTQDNITHYNYRFYFRNNQTAVLNPNLAGNFTRPPPNWQAIAELSKLPAGEYYVMVNFADQTAANSKGSKDTTNFTVIHSLNVSNPVINYINNMDQLLNISIFANSSYYYHRNFNSSDFGDGYYRIYLANGTPTSITGDLQWNGTNWIAINADVSLLPIGDYRVLCNFSTYYATTNSTLSSIFTITHTINITKPTIIFDDETQLLTILDVTAESSYFAHGNLTNLTAQQFSFEIFDNSNQSTGITGQLTWNGSEWQVIDFAAPSLQEGQYYVKTYFKDSQTSVTERSSDIFVVEYPEQEIDWVVIIIIILLVVALAIVLFWSLFPEKPEKRSEQS